MNILYHTKLPDMRGYLPKIKIEEKRKRKAEKIKAIQDYVEVATNNELSAIIDLIAKLNS